MKNRGKNQDDNAFLCQAMLRDELPFVPGDEVAVLDCSSADIEYGVAGPRSGWFPAAYIRVCPFHSQFTVSSISQRTVICAGSAQLTAANPRLEAAQNSTHLLVNSLQPKCASCDGELCRS